MVGEAALDGVAAEAPAGGGREQRVGRRAARVRRARPCRIALVGGDERCASLLAALADGVHVGAGAEGDVLAGEAGELGDPQPGLDGEREHGVVAPPGPAWSVAGGEQRVDLVVGEVGDEVALGSLGGDGQHPLDRARRARGGAARRSRTGSGSRRGGCCGWPTLLWRSCSRWSRNAAISGASRSAMSRALGVLPVRSAAKPSRSRKRVL